VQREAAEAFTQSQRREGWMALPERYHDGGFTGANMQRPALQQLLAAVEAGDVDCSYIRWIGSAGRCWISPRLPQENLVIVRHIPS
jgi:Resolvase, N terminal domain